MLKLTLVPLQPSTINEWADFWRYEAGVNVIPADTKNKKTWIQWSQYQASPISEEQHQQWKNDNAFSKGMAIIAGKVWHDPQKKDLFLAFIDLDNQKAIEEFCKMDGKVTSLEKLSEHMIVEQHKDEPNKAHIYCYTKYPLSKKSSDRISDLSTKIDSNAIPAFEVKGLGEHGIAYCTPSPHKNGANYEISGTLEPDTMDGLELHIDSICMKYNIPYVSNGNRKTIPSILDLFKEDTKIYEGHNRHEALLRVMESLISRNDGILSQEEIKQLSHKWNLNHCSPALDETEEEKQWKDAIRYIERKNRGRSNQNTSDINGEGQSESKNNNQTQNNAEIVVELAKSNTQQFFKDQYGAAFAVVWIVNHNEVIALESSRYRRYLSKLFYDNNDQKVVNSESVNNAIQILQAKAEYESSTIPLSLRVAWSKDKDAIYYDLTDERWRCVKITRKGWDIINDSRTLFIRYNQISQVQPIKSYEENVFDKFLSLTNIKDQKNMLLLKVYIVSLFIPDIDHTMLILHGEKGSAKSTLQFMIKLLVDPAKPALLTINNNKDEFVQQLNHNYVAFYDNVKYVPMWLSDEACKAVSKVGNTKRKLYTNDEDIVYEYQRCLGFNGINISLTEPDALDRSILIELNRIRKESNQVKSKIYTQFEEIQPRLLGYILDVLSKALSIKETIELKELPRMADFAVWGEAIARAMGYQPLEFINAYFENIGQQNVEAIEAHPLGQTIVKLCDQLDASKQPEWFGPTTECLQKLNEIAELNRIRTDSKYWPKAANSLSRSLNRIRSNLLEGLGIEVIISRVFNTSTIRIRKISPEPPEPPVSQNHEGKYPGSTGGIIDTGDTIPPATEIPPVNIPENRVQNEVSGDTGDTGGIIQNSWGGSQNTNESTRIRLLKCPHCPFQNIHPEEIAHHIEHTHVNKLQKTSKPDEIGMSSSSEMNQSENISIEK